MSRPPEALLPALELLRRGDLAGARAAADKALGEAPDSRPILEFAALLAGRNGDHGHAASCFRRLAAIAPDDPVIRRNLATALSAAGELNEAAALCARNGGDPRLLWLAGYIAQQQDRLEDAAVAYEAALALDPADFEAWNNLGNVRSALGQLDAAITAFERAISLRPDIVSLYVNLSEILAKAEHNQARQKVMRDAAAIAPDDAQVLTELGLAEAGAPDFLAAEHAFRRAISLDPGNLAAWIELGLVLENLNKTDDLDALVEAADRQGLRSPELNFMRAWSLRRQGRIQEALLLAEATPTSINPVRRAHLLAELYDRLGDSARAFAAYEEMNAASVAAKPPPPGPSYREMVAASSAELTPDQVSQWSRWTPAHEPPAPVFIVGFPRSGTTLLDTLLMNMPQVHVMEEQPILRHVQRLLGETARLANLSQAEADALRAQYFDALAAIQPSEPGKTIVDKNPLHMAQMPLIHRIFPDAKVIFVERHPCDAVLSCFMANFQLNLAMRSFTDLAEAALTYDAVFENWTRATQLWPINVHRIRYERMVETLEAEMKALLAFLELTWDPAVLDNRGIAAKRAHIRTASYSQVTEPIYRRSSGRWRRYRRQLEPILPILEPWARNMGYDL